MSKFADEIANTVLRTFDALPAKCKPAKDSGDGSRFWVPLSGIVVAFRDEQNFECVALGTGMKCLPTAKLPRAAGLVLHDWHAEILAIRAFNHFLLRECCKVLESGEYTSLFIRRRNESEFSEMSGAQPFALRKDMKLSMYCSEAPCGDASMELVMDAQQDATPWPVADPFPTEEVAMLKGRASFSELGIVRRKPSRSDSPLTLSKSCSDKIALKQCTSLLSSLASVLISPIGAYIDTLVLPASQYNQTALDRAFGTEGRMNRVNDLEWSGGYSFSPFKICKTDVEFVFSRRSSLSPDIALKGSNISAAYNPSLQETLINGVLQGRKQFDEKGGSALCNARMCNLFCQISVVLVMPSLYCIHVPGRYEQFKESEQLQSRRKTKEGVRRCVLKGWIRNNGDDFELSWR